MGCFSVNVKIGSQSVPFLVDTGATFTNIPVDKIDFPILKTGQKSFVLANGAREEMETAEALIEIEGFSPPRHCPITIGRAGSSFLLGATALEIFMLMPDPMRRMLVQAEGLML